VTSCTSSSPSSAREGKKGAFALLFYKVGRGDTTPAISSVPHGTLRHEPSGKGVL
jgi:hypothetical protein